MSDSQPPDSVSAPDPTPNLTLQSLAAAHESLRAAFHVTLVLLLILTGSLFVFFLREVSIARRQINELTKVVTDYQKNVFPVMEDFRTKLQAFAKTHPDFAPIYAKYFGTNAPPAGSASGRAQPLTNPSAARLPPSGG